jgi:hypothetical protein
MGTDDMVGVSGAGRDGIPTVRPAPGQPRHGHWSAAGVVAVPDQVIRAWEGAYRQYGQVNEIVSRMSADDPVAAWQMATASWAVASAWREIATVSRLPWWVLAAVDSAAEAFEAQARYWEVQESSGESPSSAEPDGQP